MFDQLVNVLPTEGYMPFADFVVAARAAGARPDLWLRAKHAGALHTVLDENGQLQVARGAQPEPEEA